MGKPEVKIVFADDDSDDHFFFNSAIEAMAPGLSVQFVFNGQQLIDYLIASYNPVAPDSGLPKLILIDLNMPLKGGIDTIKEIKNHKVFKKIPVYVLTTSNKEMHKSECALLGVSGYYEKPIKETALRSVLSEIFMKEGLI